jgi:hypothetical protein
VELTESKHLAPLGKMLRPQGITIDSTDNVIVCDSRRNCIRIMDTSGNLTSTVERVGTHHLAVPVNVTLLRSGELAVLDVFGTVSIF